MNTRVEPPGKLSLSKTGPYLIASELRVPTNAPWREQLKKKLSAALEMEGGAVQSTLLSQFFHQASLLWTEQTEEVTGSANPIRAQERELQSLRDEKTKLLLELERRKTEVLFLGRELNESRSMLQVAELRATKAEERAEAPLDCISQLSRANASLALVSAEKNAGRLYMHEHNLGVVVKVLEESVVVRFETSQGLLEQTYDKSQFIQGKLPTEGMRFEVHVFAWCRPHESKGIAEFLTPEQMADVSRDSEEGTRGPIEI